MANDSLQPKLAPAAHSDVIDAQGFFIEPTGTVDGKPAWQSVFPESLSDHSQLHSSIEDARGYIRGIAGDVAITVLA